MRIYFVLLRASVNTEVNIFFGPLPPQNSFSRAGLCSATTVPRVRCLWSRTDRMASVSACPVEATARYGGNETTKRRILRISHKFSRPFSLLTHTPSLPIQEEDEAPTVANGTPGGHTAATDDAYDPRSDDRLGPFARGLDPSQGPTPEDLGEHSERDLGVVYPPSTKQPEPAPTAANARGKEPPKKDVSQLIADKLLAGWALLDTYCPLCNSPIVRNKQKRMFCVQCDLFLVTEEDMKRDAAAKEARAAEDAAAAAPTPAVARTPTAAPATTTTAVPAALAAVSLAAPDHRSLVQAALGSVLRKLVDYGARLEGSGRDQLAQDAALLDTMARCADVAERLQRLLGDGGRL